MSEQQNIPTTVVTGFLGSGKTTVIKHLVEYLTGKGLKVAYVKNEIGDEDFDTELVQGENIATKELLNGCICCTLVGPFMAAIDELSDTHRFDRIIIETAGSADPASMALSVSNHPRLFRDGVITIVDVVHFDGYADLSFVAKRQAELTDLIVFNKVELADTARKQAVVGYVRELNEKAPIVEAIGGVLNPHVAFGIGTHEVEHMYSGVEDTHHFGDFYADHDRPHDHHHDDYDHSHNHHDQHHDNDHDHHHHESEDGIEAFTFVSNRIFDKELLTTLIQHELPKHIIRIKGVVRFKTGWEVLNAVYRRYNSHLPTGELARKISQNQNQETKLIVIGYKVSGDVHNVSALFRRAELRDAAVSNIRQLK